MALAWASIAVAVGWLRMKLQLLQPSAGVRPTPLSSACAAGAAGAADRAATDTSGATVSTAASVRISLRMRGDLQDPAPRCHAVMLRPAPTSVPTPSHRFGQYSPGFES